MVRPGWAVACPGLDERMDCGGERVIFVGRGVSNFYINQIRPGLHCSFWQAGANRVFLLANFNCTARIGFSFPGNSAMLRHHEAEERPWPQAGSEKWDSRNGRCSSPSPWCGAARSFSIRSPWRRCPPGLARKGGVTREPVHLNFVAKWSEEPRPLLTSSACSRNTRESLRLPVFLKDCLPGAKVRRLSWPSISGRFERNRGTGGGPSFPPGCPWLF